MTDLRQQR